MNLARYGILLALVLTLLGSGCTTQPSQRDNGFLTLSAQGSFFVGGKDVKSDTLSPLAAYAPSGTITVDQMYVRYQIPAVVSGPPVVFIHGCCLTGKTWETTPDGRMGWDEYFVRKGFPTYVIDQAGRGRSAIDPSSIVAIKQGKVPADQAPAVFSAGREAAWTIFRFGPQYPQVYPGMLFPVQAQTELWKQMVPDWSASLPTPNPTVPALSELANRVGGTVLISHSQAGIYPFQTAALDRHGIAGIVAIEPAACPATTADMTPYRNLPILVIWGDYVELSPRWAPRLQGCRDFAKVANEVGGKVDIVMLADIGMPGHSHMLMQDSGSLRVANWISGWISLHIPQHP